jgi:DnaJ family protein B protein 4
MVTEPEQPWGRQGSTLYYTATITLLEALCGKVLSIPTFDGRELSVPVTQIVAPGVTKVVKGEGMPDVETGEKGDLVIQFATVFPETLTPAQKASIKQTLAR